MAGIRHLDLGILDGPLVLFGGPYSNAQALAALIRAAQDIGVQSGQMICTGDVVAYCGAPARSVRISQGKAYSAARMGVTTQAVLERLHREKIEIGYFCDPEITALPGGSPLKNAAGRMVGAVGVSGLTSAEDQSVTDAMAAAFAAQPPTAG